MVRSTRSATSARSTRSAASSSSKPKQTLEEEMEAITRKARLEVRQLQITQHKAATEKLEEQQAVEEQAAQEAQERLDKASASDSDVEMDSIDEMLGGLDDQLAQTNSILTHSTLSRLQEAGNQVNPNILFPANRVFPKVAVFLRCQKTHVFGIPKDMESFTLPDDSHAIAQIMAPCPQCIPAEGSTEVYAKSKCPFCRMPMFESLTVKMCLTDSCWLSQTSVLDGTQMAGAVWKEVWRKMGDRYFFVGPWEDVLTFSNDFDRGAPEKWTGGPV
ncbi:hypothetical protein CONLIGDRAFT_677484 [Coniochaeta ligniaria NRRL 30616]|uniref:Uncharacterized protein n=1 Tax=Coniochaeta ligniaria NRRL 30616 TaxID=1408157 RepID=A0A1J7JUL0_9PEZI|nr:hypothetical protein CONLIGDRAFT_677484 [Coniochaeta ligniaria NRRL 30616]